MLLKEYSAEGKMYLLLTLAIKGTKYNIYVTGFAKSMLLIMKCCPIFHHCTIVILGIRAKLTLYHPLLYRM